MAKTCDGAGVTLPMGGAADGPARGPFLITDAVVEPTGATLPISGAADRVVAVIEGPAGATL